MVQSQVTILAYIDVFVVLGVIAMLMVPLALTLRTVKRSVGAKAARGNPPPLSIRGLAHLIAGTTPNPRLRLSATFGRRRE